MSLLPVTNTLYVWFLGDPARPILVGELNLVLSGRGVSLRYASGWLRKGFPLSEDLPLIDLEHQPREKDVAAGAVDDARPDRWGERVIRLIDHPPRLSLLEFLFYAGHNRFGALGVSSSAEHYAPRAPSALPELADVEELHGLVRRVLAGEPIDPARQRLIAPGATMGGARPKALLRFDGAEWVLKFAEDDRADEPQLEHAAMTLASKAGIAVAETRLIPLGRGFAVAVRRFDRTPDGLGRIHAVSANVALKAAGVDASYPNFAQLLRRRGVAEGDLHRQQMRELFRRLIFNILIDNTDDHEKNHALLLTDTQHYLLSPAFDILPTGLGLGYQSIGVGIDGAVSSVENALSMCTAYWLSRREAIDQARAVAQVVDTWQAHFAAAGVDRHALQTLAERIDRPDLLDQRKKI